MFARRTDVSILCAQLQSMCPQMMGISWSNGLKPTIPRTWQFSISRIRKLVFCPIRIWTAARGIRSAFNVGSVGLCRLLSKHLRMEKSTVSLGVFVILITYAFSSVLHNIFRESRNGATKTNGILSFSFSVRKKVCFPLIHL